MVQGQTHDQMLCKKIKLESEWLFFWKITTSQCGHDETRFTALLTQSPRLLQIIFRVSVSSVSGFRSSKQSVAPSTLAVNLRTSKRAGNPPRRSKGVRDGIVSREISIAWFRAKDKILHTTATPFGMKSIGLHPSVGPVVIMVPPISWGG